MLTPSATNKRSKQDLGEEEQQPAKKKMLLASWFMRFSRSSRCVCVYAIQSARGLFRRWLAVPVIWCGCELCVVCVCLHACVRACVCVVCCVCMSMYVCVRLDGRAII